MQRSREWPVGSNSKSHSKVGNEGGVRRELTNDGQYPGIPCSDDTGNRAGPARFFDFCNHSQYASISYSGLTKGGGNRNIEDLEDGGRDPR